MAVVGLAAVPAVAAALNVNGNQKTSPCFGEVSYASGV